MVAHSGAGGQSRVRQLQHGAELFPTCGGQGVQDNDAPWPYFLRCRGDELGALQPRLRQHSGGQGRHGGKARKFLRHGLQHVPGHQDVRQGQGTHGVRRQGAVAQAHHQHRPLALRQQRCQLPGDAPGTPGEEIPLPLQVGRQLHGDVFPNRPAQLLCLLRVRQIHGRQGIAVPHPPAHRQARPAGETGGFQLCLGRFQRQIRSQYAHACGHTPF